MEPMDASAEHMLEGLDEAQRAAATTLHGPVRIIAGA
ncbi:DNA helicase II, partial [Bifidobacterium scardovii]